MYIHYFDNCSVRSKFQKEFVSLWPNWLGADDIDKLDTVTKLEWSRFSRLIKLIFEQYEIQLADISTQSLFDIENIVSTLPSYTDSMNKDASQFSKFILPELQCIVTEEWDYTYIIWHQNNGAIDAHSPFIKEARLYHFQE